MDEVRGQSLRTKELPPGTVVAVGDVLRLGDGPFDFGRVTRVLGDGRHGPLVAVYRQAREGLGVPKVMRLPQPVVVDLEDVPYGEARREYALEAARRVTRRLNAQGGYR